MSETPDKSQVLPPGKPRDPRHVVDPRTLEMLVCPLTKTRLSLSDDGTELISLAGRLSFPIRQGVPMLSLDEAREFDPEDMQRHLPQG